MARSRRSKKKTEEKMKKVILKIFLFFLLFVFLIIGLYYLANWNKFHVNEIIVTGNNNIEESLVLEKVEEVMSHERLWLFTNENVFLFPERMFLNGLKESEKKVQEVSLVKIYPNSIRVDIKEREPEHEWCDGDNCYLMDEEGLIFSSKYNEKKYLTFSGSENLSSDNIIGSYYSNREDFRALNNFIRAAKDNFGLYFSNIRNNDEFSKVLENTEGTKVIINNYVTDQDLINFSRILEESDLAVRDGEFIKGVDYINMIHGNKIFYCMKTEEDNLGNLYVPECVGNFDLKQDIEIIKEDV